MASMLVLEDHAPTRARLFRAASDGGIDVVACSRLGDFLSHLLAARFDAASLDLDLGPGSNMWDGLRALDAIVASNRRMLVIAHAIGRTARQRLLRHAALHGIEAIGMHAFKEWDASGIKCALERRGFQR